MARAVSSAAAGVRAVLLAAASLALCSVELRLAPPGPAFSSAATPRPAPGGGGRYRGECELLRKETLCEARGEPVRRLTFRAPPGTTMNVETGLRQVVLVEALGERRMYSPTTEPNRPDRIFHLVVRVYSKGLVSRWLDDVSVGGHVPMVWPFPAPLVADRRNAGRRVGLVAFGVGITEMYRVAASELQDPAVDRVVLLYATRSREEQRVLEPELEELAARHPERFRLERTLTRERAPGRLHGRVDAEMVKRVFPWADAERDDVRFLSAGTRGMMAAFDALLEEAGFDPAACKLIRSNAPKRAGQ